MSGFVSRYRYGFNGKEKDDEVSGNGNSYDYGFRIYNPRLGKFLSVDPLFKTYPFFTPYQFAGNKPISGIDLDGLEYLDNNEARIKIVAGEVHINLDNFNTTTRNAWKRRDEAGNWPAGNIGWPTNVGSLSFVEAPKPSESVSMDPTYDPDVNKSLATTYTRTNIGGVPTAKSTGQPDRRYKATKINEAGGVQTGTGSSAGGVISGGRMAGAALAINAINWGLEQVQIWNAYEDQTKVAEHRSILFNQVTADLNAAISKGMIPEKYQNTNDLANIASVVLSGTNPTGDKEIYNIGIQIVKEISKNYRQPMQVINIGESSAPTTAPADATQVNKTIVVPKVENNNN